MLDTLICPTVFLGFVLGLFLGTETGKALGLEIGKAFGFGLVFGFGFGLAIDFGLALGFGLALDFGQTLGFVCGMEGGLGVLSFLVLLDHEVGVLDYGLKVSTHEVGRVVDDHVLGLGGGLNSNVGWGVELELDFGLGVVLVGASASLSFAPLAVALALAGLAGHAVGELAFVAAVLFEHEAPVDSVDGVGTGVFDCLSVGAFPIATPVAFEFVAAFDIDVRW